jgi:TolB-like protein/DNA-binding winged helix-turn-helix (wHTH) protein/Tfp pilus assembly protein PilF
MQSIGVSNAVRFGPFKLDLKSGELHKYGRKICLQEQPFRLLKVLIERPGEVVTREELRNRLWPNDTNVEFGHSINSAVKRLRDVLGENADKPKYVETVARRGYRFLPPVEWEEFRAAMPATSSAEPPLESAVSNRASPAQSVIPPTALEKRLVSKKKVTQVAVVLALGALLTGLVGESRRPHRFGQPASEHITSLAVLPLENLSGDKGQDYFADGMTEALITELGRIDGLRVISGNSVMRYKGTHPTLPEIGRELNTQAVLQGAVERSEGRLRITAKLIRAMTEEQLWEKSFERDLRDIVGLQSALAQSIASEIRMNISPSHDARMRIPAHRANARAVDFYLQGLAKFRAASTKEDFYEAIAFFERALTADPQYAPGYAGLAEAYSRLGFRHLEPRDRVKWKAHESVERALEIDPGMAQAYLVAGQIAAEFEWNPADAERFLRKALELEPGNSEVHRSFAQYVSMYAGRVDEALLHFHQAESLDPFNVQLTTEVGRCYYQFRRYNEAITELGHAAKRAPDYVDAHFFLGLAYLGLEEYQPAIAELEKAVKLADRAPAELAYFSHAVGRSGDRARARMLHAELIGLAKKTYVPDHYLAISLIGLGRVDEAIEHLRKALKDQTISGKFSKAPIYDSIRDRPEFVALARQFPPDTARSN